MHIYIPIYIYIHIYHRYIYIDIYIHLYIYTHTIYLQRAVPPCAAHLPPPTPQHFLYFRPDPQVQGSLGRILRSLGSGAGLSARP